MERHEDQLNNIRVLVVEDDRDTRQMLTFIFEQSGADVVAAGSFNEAMKAYREMPPNVVVADIGMPDYNGYALISRMREEDRELGRTTPAIALTAYTSEADRQQALSAGFQKYMAKPFEPAELIANVVDLIRPAA
jgi:DNA-binding response OmpR family regulator